jgi:hypothetical protein
MCSPTGPTAPAQAACPPAGIRSLAGLFAPGMPEPALSSATAQKPLTAEDPSGAAEKLAGLCREFPGFRIWREITGDRTRYIARSLHTGTSPHTVVTDDLGELRDVLRAAQTAQRPGASRPQ